MAITVVVSATRTGSSETKHVYLDGKDLLVTKEGALIVYDGNPAGSGKTVAAYAAGQWEFVWRDDTRAVER